MLRDILKLAGTKELSKYDQKSMNGSGPLQQSKGCCNPALTCCTTNPAPWACSSAWGNSSCQFLYSNGCCV